MVISYNPPQVLEIIENKLKKHVMLYRQFEKRQIIFKNSLFDVVILNLEFNCFSSMALKPITIHWIRTGS